jgi:hypothetical protein
LAEPLGDLEIGSEIELHSGDAVLDRSHALVMRRGVVARAELVESGAVAHWTESQVARVTPKKLDVVAVDSADDVPIKSLARDSGSAVAAGGTATPEAGDDVRTLWVSYDSHGERYKEFRDVISECSVQKYSDSPIDGPVSVLELLKHMQRHGGSPRLWFQSWYRDRKLETTDRSYHEMEVLVDMLHYGAVYDQLNLAALSWAEICARRIAQHVDAYSVAGKPPSWAMARHLSGRSSTSDAVPRELRQWATKNAKEESEILSSRARALAGGGATAGGGDSVQDAEAVGALAPGAGAGGGRGRGRGRNGRGLPPAA